MNCARRLAGAQELASPSPSTSPRKPDPRPGRSPARFFSFLPALALLLGALSPFAAAPASAAVLVSNIGQTAGSNSGISAMRAQAFTTGANTGGYDLTSIEVQFANSMNAAQRAALRVELWSESSGEPGTRSASLTVPSSVSSGAVSFAAPAGTTLTPSTTYFVVIYQTGAASSRDINLTASNDEDSGGATGWSVADSSLWVTGTDPTSATWATSTGLKARIRVNGEPKQAATTIWSATLTADEDSTGAYFGCDNEDAGQDDCSSATVLTEDDFTYAGASHTIEAIYWDSRNNQLSFVLDTSLTSVQVKAALGPLTLNVDGAPLAIGDSIPQNQLADLVWDFDPSPDWADGTTVELSLTEAPIWSATLTVKDLLPALPGTLLGCGDDTLGGAGAACEPAGALTVDDFTFQGAAYDIVAIGLGGGAGQLTFTLDKAIPGSLVGSLALTVGSRSLALADGTLGAANVNDDSVAWSSSGVSWSEGDTVELSLRERPAPPTNLRVTAAQTSLALSWTAPAGTLTGYDVHYTESRVVAADAAAGSTASTEWVAVSRGTEASPPTASQTISSLTENTFYRVRVRAKDAVGESAWVTGSGTPVASGALLLSMSIDSAAADEGDSGATYATVTVSLSAAQTIETRGVSVCFAGTATEGTDYTVVQAASATRISLTSVPTACTGKVHAFSFAAQATSYQFRLAIAGDADVELDETVHMRVQGDFTASATSSAGGELAYTIRNDDTPIVGFSESTTLANEGETETTSVHISAPLASPATVTLNVESRSTATENADFTLSTKTLTFAAGETDKEFTLTALTDTLHQEGEETAYLTLTLPGDGTFTPPDNDLYYDQLEFVILDSLPPLSIGITGRAEATVSEGESVDFFATLGDVAPTGGATVTLTIGGTSTATETTDYAFSSKSIAIAESETDGGVTLTVVDDAVDDDDETIVVNASATVSGETLTATATVTITDNDSGVAAPGGLTAAAGNARLDLSWTAPSGASPAITGYDVQYTSAAASVLPDDSLETSSEQDDAATKWVTWRVNRAGTTSTIDELTNNQEYRVRVRAVNANGGGAWAHAKGTPTATVVTTPAATIARGTSPVTEGTAATFTVTLSSAAPGGGVTVNLTVADAAGSDFVAAADEGAKILAFNAGDTSRTYAVATVADSADEPDGGVTVTVASGTGYTVGSPSSATVTVNDDDEAPPTVSLSASPNPVTEGSSVTIKATLSRALTSSVTIPVTVTRNSSQPGDHGTLASITVSANAQSGAATIATTQDAEIEGDEAFTVALGGNLPSTVRAGSPASVRIVITDDDEPAAVSLSASPNPVAEGSSVTITATLGRALPRSVTVPVTVTMDTSEAGDHGTLSGIRISANATSGTGTIATADDPDTEDERFTVALGTLPATLTAGSPTSVQVAIDDDDTPAVNILHARPNAVVEGRSTTITLGLSAPLPGAVTIPLRIEDETTDANDRGSISGVTFAAGATTATGTVATVKDADTETESFKVRLDADRLPAEVSAGTRAWVRIWIEAEGSLADVWLSASPNPVAEGGTVTVEVRLEPPLDRAVTVPIDVYSTDPDKHGALTGIAVGAGAASGTGTIETYHDDDWHDERMLLHVGDVSRVIGLRAVSWISTVSVDVVVEDDEEAGAAGSAWFLPAASDPAVTGVVRVANRSDAPGAATLVATDDAGRTREPVTLSLGARSTAEFDAADLERGNPAKGLAGSTGPGMGAWRLGVAGAPDVEASAYAVARDGFAAPLDALVPRNGDGTLAVALFEPADRTDARSLLRLVNPGTEEAEATVSGIDDLGRPGVAAVQLAIPAGAACAVDAAQLETGTGLPCGPRQTGLGDGTGRWRLAVESDARLVAMNLLRGADGRLANLSAAALPEIRGAVRAPLFPAASDPAGRQGVVRIVNRSARAGTVRIAAADDTARAYAPLTLALGPGRAVDLDADDLELGARAKGLAGSTGAGAGSWRLALTADVEFSAHAYVRARDGFLTAARPVRIAASGEGRRTPPVALLDAERGALRLANPGPEPATATLRAVDDAGMRPGGPVRVLVPARSAVELTAAQLRSGDAAAIVSGALGEGGGWRLAVEADAQLAAMSLSAGPGGHTAELSGGAGARYVPEPPAETPDEPDALER